MSKRSKCLLAILGVFAVANAAVLLTDRKTPDRQSVWEQTELPGKLKARVLDMIGEGHYQEAIPTLRNYLRHAPNDGDIRRLLGKVLFETGRYGEAGDAYYTALLNDPGDFVARNNMGVVLMKQGRRQDARRELEDALEASEHEMFVAVNLACLYELTGDAENAAKTWDVVRRGTSESGEVMIPDDALMIADAPTIAALRERAAGREAAAKRH